MDLQQKKQIKYKNTFCQTISSSEHDKNLSMSVSKSVKDKISQVNLDDEIVDTSFPQREFICSVKNEYSVLPHIKVKIGNAEYPFLVDTGSSISLLSHELFVQIKQQLKYKSLSTNVTINTVNSVVSFKGCIQLSFKIDRNFFKHPLFLIQTPSNSTYVGILGYDFLAKFAINIFPSEKVAVIKNEKIDLCQNNQINCTQTFCCTENVNIYEVKNLNEVTLTKKVLIQPFETIYASVVMTEVSHEKNFLFEPSIQNEKIIVHDSLHEKSDLNNAKQNSFFICIQNKSNETVHLNKGYKVGSCSELVHIIETSTQENYDKDEHINLIQASPNVLKQRLDEFNIQNFDLQHLTDKDECTQMESLLSSNWKAFSSSLNSIGHTDLVKPKLKFTQSFPIKALPFPIPQSLQEEAKTQLDQLQAAGIIQKNSSEWASPMLLVKKKDDGTGKQKYRLALDLRLVNSILLHSNYPLPKIQDIISKLANFQYFTSLDLAQAYHQVDLPTEYRDCLSFTTPFGTYQYNRLVFGLKTAASTFQELIDIIVEELNETGIFAYQDDLVIASNSFAETVLKLEKVLKILTKYNLTLSPTKCKIHMQNINYLGFNISKKIITPITANIVKITSFPTPKTKRQLKKFIGICGYYRHLVPVYSKIIQPLIDLTKPKTKFVWNNEVNQAFQHLQNIFFKAPFIKQPDWNKTFYLNTDASKIAISAVLMQEFDGQFHPISYFSKTLTKAESNYPAIKAELMAIVKGINAFKYYLFGRQFVIISDSKPLAHYRKITSPADLITRWLNELSEYTFQFQHVQGKNNLLADYFSRTKFDLNQENLINNQNLIHSEEVLPIIEVDQQNLNCIMQNSGNNYQIQTKCISMQDSCNLKSYENLNAVLNAITCKQVDSHNEITPEVCLREQLRDEHINHIYNSILNNPLNNTFKQYLIDEKTHLLMYLNRQINPIEEKDQTEIKPRIVIPNTLRQKALAIAHFSHLGLKKTYAFLSARYYWKRMYVDSVNYIASCNVCATSKHHAIPAAPLQPTYIPKQPGEFVSLDIVGPFYNNQYILTVIDHFSRHMELFPLGTISAKNVMESFLQYITLFGRPSVILTDLGKQFTSEIFELFNKSLGIKLTHTTAARPQANAVSERINTSIKSSINALVQDGHSFKTSMLIHKALYNASTHSTTKCSPNLVHFGRELSLLFDTFDPTVSSIQLDKSQSLHQVLATLNKVYLQVYKNLKEHQNLQNQKYKSKLRKFSVNDIVYMKSRDVFKPKFVGPYKILEQNSQVTYTVQLLNNPSSSKFKIHIDRLHKVLPRLPYLNSNDKNGDSNIQPSDSFRYQLRSRTTS